MRCAVLGSPIAHSLSPVMHRAAYLELGVDWDYDAVEVSEGELPGFLDGLDDGWRGLSVTAPLKRALVPLLDDVSEDVELLGVANTVLLGEERVGFNTDVPGGLNALRAAGIDDVVSARILGGGATAASMALTLSRLGARRLEVVVRDVSRADDVVDVARRCGMAVEVSTLTDHAHGDSGVDVLVSTIPSAVVDPFHAHRADAVFDVVYDPWPTALASEAETRGIPVVSGLDLLAHQAALQVHLMTGGTVRPSLLRGAAALELAGR
ncbi:shikimate dehydrogenase [Aeromicrobium sp. Leaf350]|uniref:shikimate dehydrogenase n=1 Tax=Aeromicrobium sp. Leaf350 TaxID=2876565 RepID=UPI001E556652|nr:shikimate dehydrogenase [Aeromicrobium sp. Leaf350]